MIALELALMLSLPSNPHSHSHIASLSLLCTHAGGLTALPFLPTAAVIGLKCLASHTMQQRVHCAMQLLYGSDTLNDSKKYKLLFDHHQQRCSSRVAPSFTGAVNQLLAVATHYISHHDLVSLRHNSTYPKLIITGTNDLLVRPINSYLLHNAIGGQLLLLHGAGHGFVVEMPTEVNDALFAVIERSERQQQRLLEAAESVEQQQLQQQLLLENLDVGVTNDLLSDDGNSSSSSSDGEYNKYYNRQNKSNGARSDSLSSPPAYSLQQQEQSVYAPQKTQYNSSSNNNHHSYTNNISHSCNHNNDNSIRHINNSSSNNNKAATVGSLYQLLSLTVELAVTSHMTAVADVLSMVWVNVAARLPLP